MTNLLQIYERYEDKKKLIGSYSKLSKSAKGELDRAIQDYDQAIKFNPKDASAYYNRGIVYATEGDKERAIAHYRKALQLNPSHELARNKLKALGETP